VSGLVASSACGSSGPGLSAASCDSLPATCGASGSDSCCSTLEVTGGQYFRSFDAAGDPNSGETNFPATVSSFRLDKYEVTVGRFRKFVEAGLGTQSTPPQANTGEHEGINASGWDASWNTLLVADKQALVTAVKCNDSFQTWTDTTGANENRPMNCLTWYEAVAFCAWDGGFLPTEAEWNYAAAGGDQQRAFPWSGSEIDGSFASFFDGTDCLGDGTAGCALTDLAPVGTKPAGDGRWGQSDLAGNVAEWTLDGLGIYQKDCEDCVNLAAGSDRVIRGGSFGQSTFYLRTGTRASSALSSRNHGLGIRCARTL